MSETVSRRRPVTTIALGLLGALAAAICVQAAYAYHPDLILSLDVDAPLTRGLYPAERAADGTTFAWTRSDVTIMLPEIDRAQPWQFELRCRGARADEAELPEVLISVDGGLLLQRRTTNQFQDFAVTMPADPVKARGARINVHVSTTMVPGPSDPRQLGVLVDEIRVRPVGGGMPWAPWRLLWNAALAGAIYGLLVGGLGLSIGALALAIGLIAIGQAAVLVTGAGPYTRYADAAPTIAFEIAIGTLIAAGIARYWAAAPLRRTARVVLVGSAIALFLKLLILLHPNMPIGDALFQAHRYEWVRDGRWIFTSVAPGGYEFPYAIALYVAALPFDSLVSGSLGVMVLLRILVAVADALAGLLLYPIVVSQSDNRRAGAVAVGLFHLIPLNLGVQTVGNLTNAFGQSLFVFAIAGMLLGLLRPAAYGRLALLTLLMAAAWLAHTSTFLLGVPAFIAIGLLFWWRGASPDVRALARPLWLVTLASAVIAVALYYGHFGDTYAALWQRLGGEALMPAEARDPAGRSVATQIATVPYYLHAYFGWPALLLAIGGVPMLRRRSPLALTLAGWLATAAIFLVFGLLTPIDVRHYLAAFPALALLGGFGASRGWRAGPILHALILVLLCAAALEGARHALAVLR